MKNTINQGMLVKRHPFLCCRNGFEKNGGIIEREGKFWYYFSIDR